MFEAYKVGVTIALTNHVTRGLLGMQRDFTKTDAHALRLKNTLHSIERLALKGALAGGLGFAGLKAIGAAVKPAEEYVHQLELAKSAGMSQLEIARATGAAWKTTGAVLTTTAADNLKSVRELRMVFGDTAEATAFLPQMQKIQAVLDSVLHGVGGVGSKDVAFTTAKALELRGASKDPKTFGEQADLIVKGVIASGGKFTPHMLMQAQKYAGAAGMNFSNDFMYGILPTLVQEMGGSSTGTMLTAMNKAVVGGRIDKKALPYWLKYGFAKKVKGVTGETAMIEATNAEVFQDNPFHYMQYVDAELKKRGFKTQKQRSAILGRLFRVSTSERAANLMAEQAPRLEKDFNLIGKAGTSGEYDRLIKTDPVMARQAAAAQWDNLKTVVGLEVLPILIPAIKGLADGLHAMSDWARANPGITKSLVLGFTALSGALLFSGSLLTLKAGFKGLSLLLGPGSNLIKGAGSLALAIGPLGLAAGLVAAAGALVYFRHEIAAFLADIIDKKNPWVGDAVVAAREGRFGEFALDGLIDGRNRGQQAILSRIGPPPGGGSQPIHTTVNIDGRKVAHAVTTHQQAAMNRPASSSGSFDAGAGFAPTGGYSGAW